MGSQQCCDVRRSCTHWLQYVRQQSTFNKWNIVAVWQMREAQHDARGATLKAKQEPKKVRGNQAVRPVQPGLLSRSRST